ncbi:MAG: subtype I-B CRISPR-associated endonuclease Cas1 [Candidatus Aenigmatarchaeota archaeon]|nr:MAG: subtype I-B CRISPR-associated endonuclease Cas1 [Candidatus Aenigmarchaeota archaeon]
MKRNLYLNQNGRLHRKESTIYYYSTEGRKIVPVNQVKAVFAVGRISVTSGVLSFFSKIGIPIHFFGYYGNYEGSFYPRRKLISGYAVLNQAAAHLDGERRLHLARAFVSACIKNMISVVESYVPRRGQIAETPLALGSIVDEVENASTIPILMSMEGRAWSVYYDSFNHIIRCFEMGPRVKRPPNNPVNALISFGNSLLYSAVLTQIYHTQLDPSISFLHEPLERRFSLALDISEVFKPGLVDMLIFKLLNRAQIREEHFDKELNYCVLSEEGRRLFLTAFDDTIRATNRHPRLKRKVSNEYLLRLDCYKILRNITEAKPFRPFLMSTGG